MSYLIRSLMETRRSTTLGLKIIVILVIGILAGGGVVYIFSYRTYTPKINEIETKLRDVESEFETLSMEYDALNTERDNLQSQHSELSLDYNKLQGDYNSLSYDYQKASEYLKALSRNVTSFYDMLGSYGNLTEAFRRVLNNDELEKIAPTVISVSRESEDNWYVYDRIYRYVAKVDYSHDIEFPYIKDYHYDTMNGDEVLTGFSVDTTMNYIQTPAFTIEHGQGDAEDQVITTYAMIKYYEKNIYGTEYPSYIAEIQFSHDSKHLAVFLPVKGGRTQINRLCILNPFESYYTNEFGQMTKREVSKELKSYSSEFLKTAGEIEHIKLYDVDVNDGSYTVVVSGTLDEVSTFLETL